MSTTVVIFVIILVVHGDVDLLERPTVISSPSRDQAASPPGGSATLRCRAKVAINIIIRLAIIINIIIIIIKGVAFMKWFTLGCSKCDVHVATQQPTHRGWQVLRGEISGCGIMIIVMMTSGI